MVVVAEWSKAEDLASLTEIWRIGRRIARDKIIFDRFDKMALHNIRSLEAVRLLHLFPKHNSPSQYNSHSSRLSPSCHSVATQNASITLAAFAGQSGHQKSSERSLRFVFCIPIRYK